MVDMFLGEARIAAMLNHPNIVDIYGVASEGGMHFIAMEYIRGKTLTEFARRAIEVSQLLYLDIGAHVVAEVAAALAYMNEAPDENGQPMHVVHRDVSPTNVIIGTSGQVKLIDFGIARQGTAIKDEEGMRPGKASYMSPEQAQGIPLDGRSDIFSLGTILYEITVGRRLWRGSRENAIRRIVEEKPAPPTYVRHDYPGDLEMIVMRALEKKPEDRYQSAHEFADALQYFLQDSGARMRSHHQLARYLRELYSPEAEAQITEDGLRQARLFAEGDEDGQREDAEALDFDQAAADGPGAALARALRAAGSALSGRRSTSSRLRRPLPVAKAFPGRDSAVRPLRPNGGQAAAPMWQPTPAPADDLRSAVRHRRRSSRSRHLRGRRLFWSASPAPSERSPERSRYPGRRQLGRFCSSLCSRCCRRWPGLAASRPLTPLERPRSQIRLWYPHGPKGSQAAMKFVCDRCQTRYSIADEKVRQRILRIRCKTCGNVITVQAGAVVTGAQDSPARQEPRAGSPSASRPSSRLSLPPTRPHEWFVAVDGVEQGPLSCTDRGEVHRVAQAGTIRPCLERRHGWLEATQGRGHHRPGNQCAEAGAGQGVVPDAGGAGRLVGASPVPSPADSAPGFRFPGRGQSLRQRGGLALGQNCRSPGSLGRVLGCRRPFPGWP